MTVTAIAAVDSLSALQDLQSTMPSQRPSAMDAFERLVSEANNDVNTADLNVRKLVVGDAPNLHDVMISIESARVSMGLLVQVRNRLVDAYQDLMRMQI